MRIHAAAVLLLALSISAALKYIRVDFLAHGAARSIQQAGSAPLQRFHDLVVDARSKARFVEYCVHLHLIKARQAENVLAVGELDGLDHKLFAYRALCLDFRELRFSQLRALLLTRLNTLQTNRLLVGLERR